MDIGYRQIHGHDYAFVIVFDDDDEFETFCSELRFICNCNSDAMGEYSQQANAVTKFLDTIAERCDACCDSDDKIMTYFYKNETFQYVLNSIHLLFCQHAVDIVTRNNFACAIKTFNDMINTQEMISEKDNEVLSDAHKVIDEQMIYIHMLEKRIAELTDNGLEQSEIVACRDKVFKTRDCYENTLKSFTNMMRSMRNSK